MALVTGQVEQVSTNFGKFGIKINGSWYNTKLEWMSGKPTPVAGDTVTFDDGGKTYIKGLKIGVAGAVAPVAAVSKAISSPSRMGSFPIGVTDGQRSICRQNALTNAINYVSNIGSHDAAEDTVGYIIEIAKRFEAYTTGSADADEILLKTQQMQDWANTQAP